MSRVKHTSIMDQLRAHVEAREESENAIAKELGIDQGNFNKFLLGKRGVSVEALEKLCRFLDLELVRRN